MTMLTYNNLGEVAFFAFPPLDKLGFVKHAVYARQGGNSTYPFESLNISFNVGDFSKCVRENRSIIDKISGGILTLYPRQTHGAKILVLERKHMLPHKVVDANIWNDVYPADAVITDIPGINIAIQTADCQSVYIIDPSKKVIANVHVGWRGSVSNILEKTVVKMIKHFSCRPSHLIAAINPSLGPCCAEFSDYNKELPASFQKYKSGGSYFDFWKISKNQLCKTGILYDSIYCSKICTKCNPLLFFSYRGGGKTTGRFASLIRIRN